MVTLQALLGVDSEVFTVNSFPLLEFDRKPINAYLLRCFVLTWNADLTLVHVLDDHSYRLNGYAVFRNSDIKRWRSVRKDEFFARAARLHALRPKMPEAVNIASMKEAVSWAGAAFPLIAIHRERIKKYAFRVGKMLRTSQRAVAIQSISPDAEWEEDDSFLLRDITLLVFGGVYEKLLMRMAGK